MQSTLCREYHPASPRRNDLRAERALPRKLEVQKINEFIFSLEGKTSDSPSVDQDCPSSQSSRKDFSGRQDEVCRRIFSVPACHRDELHRCCANIIKRVASVVKRDGLVIEMSRKNLQHQESKD